MPFIEGESLRDRLRREKQLPVGDTLQIATQVASALDYAHGRGVIHRDIKPENILLHGGHAMVADFGIALALSRSDGTTRLTETGLSLGTPQYMAPEQAMGEREITPRADIYALGCTVYEMLTGEPPFVAPTPQAIVARIMTEEPRAIIAQRRTVPPGVEAAVFKALERLAADRFSTAREFADALQGLHDAGATLRTPPRARRSAQRGAIAVGLLSLMTILLAAGWWRTAHRPPPPPPVTRFESDAPPGATLTGGAGQKVAVSPDGRSIAFVGSATRLYVRHLDALDPILYANAHPAGPALRFSSDGNWLAYWDRGPRKIWVGPGSAGAEPTPLVTYDVLGEVVSFSTELIYLYRNAFWSVPAGGGTPRMLVSADTALDVRWKGAILLPDGRTLVFSALPVEPGAPPQLALASVDGGAARTLLETEAVGVVGYADGILLYNAEPNKLMAVRLDLTRRRIVGVPVEVANHVSPSAVAMSATGTLAYLTIDTAAAKVEVIDERGDVIFSLPETHRYLDAAPSPDGERIAVVIEEKDQDDIWLYGVTSRLLTRLTQTGAWNPVWTPDGKRIAFTSRAGALWMPADGNGPAEPVPGMSGLGRVWSQQISPDGKYAIIRTWERNSDAVGTPIVFAVPLAGGVPIPLLQGAENPQTYSVSPNGRWIAYESRETGAHEVYISPFPAGPGKVQVSAGGGDSAFWSPDGRKVYYRGRGAFYAATLDLSGAMPRVARSDVLFPNRDLDGNRIGSYAVHPNGKYFVVTHPTGGPTRLVIVTGWMTEVRAKLAGK